LVLTQTLEMSLSPSDFLFPCTICKTKKQTNKTFEATKPPSGI
jgi:uncharacterized UBP type Zn finger protein